jgi:hypothetical protein
MQPGMSLDFFEEWLPRRETMLLAIAIWVAGFALAGVTARRMHATTRTGEMSEAPTSAIVTPTEAPANAAESEGAVFMPEDVVIGQRTPRIGATQIQKP